MLKYVEVDSDGYAYLDVKHQAKLHRRGFAVGRANEGWLLYTINIEGGVFSTGALTFETTDHILFDNYLKLLLED